MHKKHITTILCSILLILLSLQTAIGKETDPTNIPPISPLFNHQHPKLTNKTHIPTPHSCYLGSNNNTTTPNYFTPQTFSLSPKTTLLKKYISTHDIFHIITHNYKHNTQVPITKQLLTHLSNNKLSSSCITARTNVDSEINHLLDPYSTVFPSCVILVIITIVLLYTYILLFETTDFILQILENLL